MSKTRLLKSVMLTCTAFAVALPGCTSDQTGGGVGNVDMAVTLATPPAGPNEQINEVDVEFYCEGNDPVLGTPRPPMDNPETFTINTTTSQGAEPKNTIGLFEKQGLPAGDCHFSFTASSVTGATDCTGEITLAVMTNQTHQGEVILNCIHTPRYGGVRVDGTFNQCAEYRQILVSPTTQAIGNLVDVRTEVYDPDDDDVTVFVQAVGECGNVNTIGSQVAASCQSPISADCEAVVNTVECTGVGSCEIIVTVSDDYDMGNGPFDCNGLLPDGNNNDGARRTIAVDCTVAAGCGNGEIDPGEDCEPPNTPFCDADCQEIDNCMPDPCDQTDVCNPEVCTADQTDNSAICTPDPASAGGLMCSPPAGGSCDGLGNCVACSQPSDCEDNNDCTDNDCVAGECVFTNDNTNMCTIGGNMGNCVDGTCEGLCADVTCPDNGIECVTATCDEATGDCTGTSNDGINTGCNLDGAGPGTGVCTGAGACVECNMNGQCTGDDTCVANVCTPPAGPPTYDLSASLFKPYNGLLDVNTVTGLCEGGTNDGLVCNADINCNDGAEPPVIDGVCNRGNGTPSNDCFVPDLSANPGANLTTIETKCLVLGDPSISGSMTFDETSAGVFAVSGVQDLLFVIDVFVPAAGARVIIDTDSETVFSGMATGALPGTITMDDLGGGFNINAAATGRVICSAFNQAGVGDACACADGTICSDCPFGTVAPPFPGFPFGQTCTNLMCDPTDVSDSICTLANLSGGLNTVPLPGDPGQRTFPPINVGATTFELGAGPADPTGYYLVNPAPLAGNGTQWGALGGVLQ